MLIQLGLKTGKNTVVRASDVVAIDELADGCDVTMVDDTVLDVREDYLEVALRVNNAMRPDTAVAVDMFERLRDELGALREYPMDQVNAWDLVHRMYHVLDRALDG